MKVSDFMSKNLIYISPETTLTEAQAIMSKENIHKLPVLDKSKRLVGLVTKNDLTKASPSDVTTLDIYELGYVLSKLKIEKIMIKDVVTIDSEEVIENAALVMADKAIGCLPVMHEGFIVGIITETDIFKAFVSMFGVKTPGIRVVAELPEKTGEIARISTAVAAKNGNIVSLVTSEAKDNEHRLVTIKIRNLTIDQVTEAINSEKSKILDIREIK